MRHAKRRRSQVHRCPPLPSPVTALSFELKHGHVIAEHFHPEDQLVYASKGVMTVRTDEGTWIVPAQRAVWLPAGTPHSVVASGAVSMRTVYLRVRIVKSLSRACRVINVSPFFQQLILQLCGEKELSRRSKTHAHLIDVFTDQLKVVQTISLQLPSLHDPRATRVAAILQESAEDEHSLETVCEQAGASKRTIERLFQKETRLSLGKWRQQLRLMRALQLLAAGEKISTAALEAGYSTASSFIAMFKKVLGTTPGRYFEERSANRS